MRSAIPALEALDKIKRLRLENPDGGTTTCPQCGGRLAFGYVGMRFHVRAKCETAGCLELIE